METRGRRAGPGRVWEAERQVTGSPETVGLLVPAMDVGSFQALFCFY